MVSTLNQHTFDGVETLNDKWDATKVAQQYVVERGTTLPVVNNGSSIMYRHVFRATVFYTWYYSICGKVSGFQRTNNHSMDIHEGILLSYRWRFAFSSI